MPSRRIEPGQIITFYSFKGGVGRTMALANMAFLAAHNGLRVLMMDWDLEAPGLEYYFRGLRERVPERMYEEPGILDVLWRWHREVAYGEPEAIDELAAEYRSGRPFEDCVRSLADGHFLTPRARLDFIGAGAAQIGTPEKLSYGEALAKFSWTSFFEDHAGGVVIQSLRDWAKRNYDLVLIDSRTGLADVAGLCTMQIPDQVALCFILNRQNIDGAAQVAAAIRARRAGQVAIRVVPMRVAIKQTPEESDARARAETELSLMGGLPIEAVQEDLQLLDVVQADNVPFYEALAPFIATRPAYDPLTLNYLRLANELIGQELEVPALDAQLVEQVRIRMQPQQATVGYVNTLHLADPTRAASELQRLLANAARLCAHGVMPSEAYVHALVGTAFDIDSSSTKLEEMSLQDQAVDLARSLYAINPVQWREVLLQSLELRFGAAGALMEPDEEAQLLEEIDALLAPMDDPRSRIRRLQHRRRIAWLSYLEFNNEVAARDLVELDLVLESLRANPGALSREQAEQVLAAELDMLGLRGEIHLDRGEMLAAYDSHAAVLSRASTLRMESANPELRRMVSRSHMFLAQLESALKRDTYWGADAAMHVIEALRWADGWSTTYTRFPEFAQIVIDHGSPGQMLEMSQLVFGAANQTQLVAGSVFIGRSAGIAVDYLHVLARLVPILHEAAGDEARQLLHSMAESADQMLKARFRRLLSLKITNADAIEEAVFDFRAALILAGVEWTPPPAPDFALASTLRSQRRAKPKTDLSGGPGDQA